MIKSKNAVLVDSSLGGKMKTPAGFEPVIYKSEVHMFIDGATQLSNQIRKEYTNIADSYIFNNVLKRSQPLYDIEYLLITSQLQTSGQDEYFISRS